MSKNDLSRYPVKVTPHIWYFEDPKGLEFYQAGGSGPVFVLTWRRIKSALARKEKPHE